ncbi:energy transducer TonB [Methylomonas sp. LWB]|uniref:energy transducer TonB n=1 Tax=Methylomonas sp. LWB TaxID=1905845 RepID=UPI00158792C4|nr:energy transducer TonB [Methylomonas sp. LWB]
MSKPPQALPMMVSLISLPPAPQTQPPAPQPMPQPVKPEAKPVVKKPLVKPPAKPAPKPVQPNSAPIAQDAPISDAPVPAPTPVAASSPTAAKSAPPAVTEADYRANYATNPRPVYPAVARSHGWQGKVALRVAVTAEGFAADVKVERSSGYDVLDEAAVEAVKQWRFLPAKHGDTAVASSVVVPLNFALREEQ